ncbi:unnamed protein product [Adineta steineri]|uniref:Uncharacterized protein n=1 Tax=Adineta steineri TaxID=433720 RepID=A0A815KJZ0_9BILA|nr:unnamed protein product [Adineta steineri]CAF1611986.1 unnamed protein product [Adineta steineri]
MHIVAPALVFLMLLMSPIIALDAETYSKISSDIHNDGTDITTLKVAMYPHLPDSAGDNYAKLLQFINEEFKKIQPTINLQLRPLDQNDDFYSLATLTPWLSTDGTGYDVVEIDTLVLGDLVNAGLIVPQFPISHNHSDWHSAAASAVLFNQAVYAYPHIMCAYFLFTRDEQAAKVTTIDELINILSPNASATYRLVGNMNSSWILPSLWINSYQSSNNSEYNIPAFALHSYQKNSFETMRKFAQLCDRAGGENNCLNGVFRDNSNMTALLFAHKQTAAMFGFSENLFTVLKNGDLDDYSNVKMIPLPLGTNDNQPGFFTNAFVFRRNMSVDVLKAARLFADFMGTPRMQAAVVGSADSPNTKPRYLLPMSKNAYNEPLLANDRFYQQAMTKEHAYQLLYPSISSRSSADAFLDKLVVPGGETPIKFFWSGFGVPNSAEVAAEIARYHNGVTLEMLLERPENAAVKQQMCIWPAREDISPVAEACRAQWRRLSQVYAEKARGPVTPILGDHVAPDSVWMTHEKNALNQSQQKGNYLYGFQRPMNLYEVYCVKMAKSRSDYPEIKEKICTKQTG